MQVHCKSTCVRAVACQHLSHQHLLTDTWPDHSAVQQLHSRSIHQLLPAVRSLVSVVSTCGRVGSAHGMFCMARVVRCELLFLGVRLAHYLYGRDASQWCQALVRCGTLLGKRCSVVSSHMCAVPGAQDPHISNLTCCCIVCPPLVRQGGGGIWMKLLRQSVLKCRTVPSFHLLLRCRSTDALLLDYLGAWVHRRPCVDTGCI